MGTNICFGQGANEMPQDVSTFGIRWVDRPKQVSGAGWGVADDRRVVASRASRTGTFENRSVGRHFFKSFRRIDREIGIAVSMDKTLSTTDEFPVTAILQRFARGGGRCRADNGSSGRVSGRRP